MSEPCIQEENIGKFKEFMNNYKGVKASMFGIVVAIVLQVISFSFLWGTLTATVKQNTKFLWEDLAPRTAVLTREVDIAKVKLENIRLIAIIEDMESIKK